MAASIRSVPRRIIEKRTIELRSETLTFELVRTVGRRAVHIVVTPKGIELRVPYHYSTEWAEQDLRENFDWILGEIEKVRIATSALTLGSTVPFLGDQLLLAPGVRARPQVVRLGKRLERLVERLVTSSCPGSGLQPARGCNQGDFGRFFPRTIGGTVFLAVPVSLLAYRHWVQEITRWQNISRTRLRTSKIILQSSDGKEQEGSLRAADSLL